LPTTQLWAFLGLPLLVEVIALVVLLVIGIIIIVVIVKVILFFLPAALIALVVWLLGGSLFWAGIAFLIVAFISLAKRK